MKLLKLLFCIFVITFLTSCATGNVSYVFDENLPLEATSRISPSTTGEIIGYNGIPVNWKSRIMAVDMIEIPAGDTILEWNISASSGNYHYTGKNILFRYNFLPMKQYFFQVNQVNGSFGLRIYEFSYDEKIRISRDNYVGFFPFLTEQTGPIILQ